MTQETLPITVDSFRGDGRAMTMALLALIIGLLCFDAYALIVGINNSLNDYYEFRQTQTALTAYWLTKEPHIFAYLTPVAGSPWSIPFEYPVYQWMVFLLMKAGLPIEVAGRLISFAAFIATLVPLRMLARNFKIPNRALFIVAAVYLASPLYIFYARTFLIETTAMLFALCWLAGFVRYGHSPRLLPWCVTLGFGILAGLTKSTTFLGVGLIAGTLFIIDAVTWFREGRPHSGLRNLVASGLQCVIPLVVCFAWIETSDYIKALNPIGHLMDSKALFSFTFGTVSQRLTLYRPILRSLTETFGYFGNLIPFVVALGFLLTERRLAIGAAVAGYLAAFLLFTGLHTVHAYYQVANAIFACIAVGLSIEGLLDTSWRRVAPFLFVCVLVSQFHFFNKYFWQPIKVDNIGSPIAAAARAARDLTKPDQSLLIFGDGWSSTVPFYAERKSLAVPRFVPDDLVTRILANPGVYTGDNQVGAIVDCRLSDARPYPQTVAAAIDAFMAGRQTLYSNEWCRIASP